MNTQRSVSLIVMWFLCVACMADDRIVAVDPQSKLLTVEQNGALKLCRVVDTTDITVNGVKATMPQLLPGQTVEMKLSGALTAVKIAASGLGNASNASRPGALRSVIVQMRVDGADCVLYQDGKLWIEHMSAQNPTEIFINGVAWSPTWSGDKTEQFTKFTVPVGPIGSGHVTVKQFAGRSKVKQEHIPSAPAVVTITDAPSGADDYEFQFSW